MNKALHILHADDDAEDRWIFQDGLTENDPAIRLTQFDDGLHLLAYMKALQPDQQIQYAIICDMQMPNLTGLDVLTRVKSSPTWKNIPFIIFSTSSLVEDIRKCMDSGALAFYSKPNTFPENLRIISEMILCCKKNNYFITPPVL
jgi:CheY-like chemotaxis protein